jgi:hypothetical protein
VVRGPEVGGRDPNGVIALIEAVNDWSVYRELQVTGPLQAQPARSRSCPMKGTRCRHTRGVGPPASYFGGGRLVLDVVCRGPHSLLGQGPREGVIE